MLPGLGEDGVMGGAYGCVSEMGHTLALTSLFPTEIGLEDLGTERTCFPIPRVKFGEAERPQPIAQASVALTAGQLRA